MTSAAKSCCIKYPQNKYTQIMKQYLLIRFVAIAMASVLSACVTGNSPIVSLTVADKVGCHAIKIDSPSAMNGQSGQGTLVDLVVSSVVDAAIDSSERRRKEAEFANGIRAAVEDEFSRAGVFRYVRQSSLKGTNNDADLMKVSASETGAFATTNGLRYALRVYVTRGRGLDGLKDAPMLRFAVGFIDQTGKSLGLYREIVTGTGTSV